MLALTAAFAGASSAAIAQGVPEPSPLKAPALQPETTGTSAGNGEPAAQTEAVDTRIYQAACPALMRGEIEGKLVAPIEDGPCGERSPLEIASAGGIEMSAPVVTNCRTASVLARWGAALQPVAEVELGTRILRLTTSTGYQCRRRNNAPDGKISEHGFANAIDITGFVLENGDTVTVVEDWGDADFSADRNGDGEPAAGETEDISTPVELTAKQTFLRAARDKACQLFTTVLGPESDPHHNDHFHFDLGCHGSSCTYTICE